MSLIQRIEKLRSEMVDLGMQLGFQDPRVIETSQKLDELIVQYYRLSKA